MDLPVNNSDVFEPPESLGEDGTFVTAEEVGLVLLVLLLWVMAIALFINRWGKIRMLEPYQPAYKMSQQDSLTVQSSRMNSPDDEAVISHYLASHRSPDRPRQNSLMVPITNQLTAARKVKSAVDLVSLVIAEQREQRECFTGMISSGPKRGSNSGSNSGPNSRPDSGPNSGPNSGPSSGPSSGLCSGPIGRPKRGSVSGPNIVYTGGINSGTSSSSGFSSARLPHCPSTHTTNV